MKYILVLMAISISVSVFSQKNTEQITGNVSYISSQNVYVRFTNTNGIQVGDTLYYVQNNNTLPVLVVSNISSISCVGKSISAIRLSLNNQIVANKRVEEKPIEIESQKSIEAISVNDKAIIEATKQVKTNSLKERFDGRLSVSSYSNISTNYASNQRFRYNLSMNAEHISNSNLSVETYIAFTHKLGEWKGLSNSLKVYNLAAKYDIGKTASVSIGRKINNSMANIGAVDGLQFENIGKNFSYGAIIGTRPDTYNYSLNPNLLQFGAFISHNSQKESGSTQTSLGVFNQMNSFKTDRRFLYLQHNNTLVKNVDLFCSFEVDLYALKDSLPTTTFNLTGAYASLRFRPWKQLSMSLSYDARKNIYYYETFKNQIDSTLDKATRQGFRFQTTIRPFKYLSLGGTAGYRLPTNLRADTLASMNANGFISYSNLPFQLSTTITATTFKSGYTNGSVYGVSISRDFVDGKINLEGQYRIAKFNYSNSLLPTTQNIAELSLSWRVAKKLMISADFEATLDNEQNKDGRVFINISQRF